MSQVNPNEAAAKLRTLAEEIKSNFSARHAIAAGFELVADLIEEPAEPAAPGAASDTPVVS